MALSDEIDAAIRRLRADIQKVGVVTSTTLVGGRITVSVEGDTMQLPFISSYTPRAVNDVVLVNCITKGSWVITGRLN